MLYFAYGSNMHAGGMARRCPGCTFVAAARLRDHRLVFRRLHAAGDGGGVADIQPAAESAVEGVVWKITEAHREALDRYEDSPRAYTRKDVTVEAFDGRRLTAFAYVASVEGSDCPRWAYLRQLVVGAREHGLRPEYVAFLEAIPTED